MDTFNPPNMNNINFMNINQNIFDSSLSINDFEIIFQIGKFYNGSVLKVKYKKNGQTYIIRQYEKKRNRINDKEIDYIREKSILYDITQKGYPNVVKLYADFEDNDTRNLVMEYIEGLTLYKLRSSDNKERYLPQKLIINILTQLLETLQFLHDKCHVIHRNINPYNIILQNNNQIKLIDFKISAYLENSNKILVSKKSFKGDAKFVAPEIIFQKARNYDYKIDIFSLGFTMYSLMNPSDIENEVNVPQKTIIEGGFSRKNLYIKNTFYEPWLIDFVKYLYEEDQNKRPSASEALEKLKYFLFNNNESNNLNRINNINNNALGHNQILINNQQIINNFINLNNSSSINSEQETIFLNSNYCKDNEIVTSMKSLLQILYRSNIMNYIKNKIFSLFSNSQVNYNQLFIFSFQEIINYIQQFDSGNINQANYSQIISNFIQKIFIYNKNVSESKRPIILFNMISSIIKDEINKNFTFYQNNIFDNMIQNNFMALNNIIPILENQNIYNSISQKIVNFKNNNKGPFVDNFAFLVLYVSRCPKCNNLFDVETVDNQFLKLDVIYQKNNISDLINNYFYPKMENGNYHCQNCGLKGKKLKRLYCLNFPNYLILDLDDKNSIDFNENIILPLFDGRMSEYQYLASIYKSNINEVTEFVAIIKNDNDYFYYSNDKIEPCPNYMVNLEFPSLVIFKKMF